jgi:nicotinate-nucleotide adenylyltransferase
MHSNHPNHPNAILYYGGSFNPPHIAHVLMVSALRAYYPKAEVWVAPTYQHAFGKDLLSYDLRLQMLKAALADISGVKISTIERDLHASTSYTIDVVRSLKAQHPHKEIWIVTGSDILPQLPQWRSYEELCQLAHFLIFPRQGYDNSQALPVPYLPEVSSSQIRDILSQGGQIQDLHHLVPAAVLEIWQSQMPP